MADPRLEYVRLAARSRLAADALTRRTISTLYDEMAAVLVQLVEAGHATTFSAERAASLASSVRRLMARLAVQMAGSVGDGAALAVQLPPTAHLAAVRAAAEAAGVAAPTVSFREVPRRAVEALMARRELAAAYGADSYAGVLRTVMDRAVEGLGPDVDRLLTSQVARGLSVDRATTELAGLLARDEPELLRAVERLGPRGGRRRLQEAVGDVSADALAEGRRLMGKARRLAQTEVVTAHREADRLSAEKSPVVRAVRWRLSGNHPVPDVCSLYAVQDLHGLGAGLYHPGTAPTNPHPHCRCYLGYELRPPAEWGTPLPAPTAPREVDRAAAEALFSGQPKGYVARQVAQARRGLAVAYEVRPGVPVLA